MLKNTSSAHKPRTASEPSKRALSPPATMVAASASGAPLVGGSLVRVAAAPTTTRWKEIADAVRLDIEAGRLSVGDLLPSETALTQKWKVSRMTAHRAMQELQRSGLVTRQRGRGTLVAHNTPAPSGNVALLFHNPLDLLEIEYIRGINLGLAGQHQLLLCDSHADIGQEAAHLKKMRQDADGIICMPSCDPKNTALLREIADSGFPIVCVDRVPQDLEIDAVVSDNYGASRAALAQLMARGHSRIAHFTENQMHISAVSERHQAFIDTMREAGESHPERLVRFFPPGVQNSFEGMVQLMHDALFTLRHQADPPSAVFCLNDYCLTVLLAAIERLQLRVPEDLEILSFHDTLTLMPSVSVSLHRIVQQPRQTGQVAARRLKERLADPLLPHQVLRVPAVTYSLQADFPTPFHPSASGVSVNGASNGSGARPGPVAAL